MLDGEVVGFRWFSHDGGAGTENPLKNGLLHGTQYYFDVCSDGTLTASFAWPYREGKPHGVARQWSEDGTLIGTFVMKHGTGWDLWRNRHCETDTHYLSEARHLQDGNWHGFEWWLEEDQKSVHQEAHFWENLQHGIRRMWNSEGRLKRDYPQYWVKNERVTKRQYLRACGKDPNLPVFREIDNLPQRDFPPEVVDAINKTAQKSFQPNSMVALASNPRKADPSLRSG